MPELPEVETIVRDLNKKIKGDVIVSFKSFWPKALKNMSPKELEKAIVGKKILKVRRIGKNIFIDLSGGKTLYLHLKMTGHLLVKFLKSKLQISNNGKERKIKSKKDYFQDRVNQYIRHVFSLQNEKGDRKNLEFSDLRKFGKIVYLDTKKIMELPEIKNLGVDALSEKFTFRKWQEILKEKRKMEIGRILMEQNLIAGIGNIYRSEILFTAQVSPWRLAEKIRDSEQKAIFLAIKKILKLAIQLRGTSDSDYRDTAGAPGDFQKKLKVYNRENEKCWRKRCRGRIKRKKMAQRSVFWCQECQK